MYLFLLCAALMAADPPALHKRATESFRRADYKRALELLRQDLVHTADREIERETRSMIVLALFNIGKKEEAVDAYATLTRLFPDYRFDDEQVLPEVIAFFDERVPRQTTAPATRPAELTTASTLPASRPVVLIEPPRKKWSAAYLLPFGIGQLIAGSPVRGALFMISQVGLLALNISSALLHGQQLFADGTARDFPAARDWQTTTNVAFAGLMVALAAGLVDGIFFEAGF